jgi:hypothetical protein
MRTWFLPLDFSFGAEGPIKLGTIIPHPKRPTLVLASLGSESPKIPLPDVQTLTESNHTHSNNSSSSTGLEILAKFVELASASGTVDTSGHRNLHYGNMDHEIRSFASPFSEESLAAIVKLPKVRKHIDSGLFGKRPVYIVSGLRIAKTSFTVTMETGSASHTKLSGSGPVPAGPAPAEIGGSVSRDVEKTKTDSYDTAAGIVFAYRLHVIRSKRDGDVESEIFSHKTAFLTGDGSSERQELMEITEVAGKEVDDDLEEEAEFTEYRIGEGDCCISFEAE